MQPSPRPHPASPLLEWTPQVPAARELIVRAPSEPALRSALALLSAYPEHLLARLVERGVRLWLLDRGESLDCAPLPAGTKARRWLHGRVGQADCAGLTVPTASGPLVLAPWYRPAVVRHELGHAVGTLLDDDELRDLARAFRSARRTRRWLVPLAERSIGEYLASGAACLARAGGQKYLSAVDQPLATILTTIWTCPSPDAAREERGYGLLRRLLSSLPGRAAAA